MFLEDSLKVGSAYVIVYSVTDRSSFDSAAELRITLRRTRQAENLPIILVGNKSDLVRAREVTVEGEVKGHSGGGGGDCERTTKMHCCFNERSSFRAHHVFYFPRGPIVCRGV